AEVTAIVAGQNNPLKFSPSVEVALQHLLTPPARGFIGAGPAMKNAYSDLRIHQFAFAVGMRANLEAALQRFEPTQIESGLGDRSALRDLLPASRPARLWERFVEQYASTRKEVSADFHAAFGRAFLKAYDDHVRRLQGQRDAARRDR
nr:type VI secretion system-associated FHA domain protein TagH [Pseudomonadota bacterium]